MQTHIRKRAVQTLHVRGSHESNACDICTEAKDGNSEGYEQVTPGKEEQIDTLVYFAVDLMIWKSKLMEWMHYPYLALPL